jgi:hypothetical protein
MNAQTTAGAFTAVATSLPMGYNRGVPRAFC